MNIGIGDRDGQALHANDDDVGVRCPDVILDDERIAASCR